MVKLMQKQKIDIKELVNLYNKNFFKELSSGEFILDEYSKIMIETTNNCNFNCCTFCAHNQMERKRGFINFKLFKKIVQEAADFGFKKIDMRVYGEPLVDIKLEEKAKFAKDKGFQRIMINTNGEILTKTRFESLIRSGFNEISFSISPKREFEKTRPGKSFDKIWQNLKDVSTSKFKDAITIWVVVTEGTLSEELEQFDKDVRLLGYKNINYTPQTRHSANINNETASIIENKVNCFALFRIITVFCDGSLALCPSDYNNKIKLGNLQDNSLAELINSEQLKKIRHNHVNMNYLDLCQRCDIALDTFYEIYKNEYDLPNFSEVVPK
jgi:radical SAM protein with 4Fe4S-binding SPASM domain